MTNPDLSTVTDEQLCRTAEMAGNPLMWELAKRFRESSAIAQAAREAGLVKDGKLRDFTTASCNTTGIWEQSTRVPGDCKVVFFIVPRSAAERAANGGTDGH